MKIKKPNSYITEILHTLIRRRKVSLEDFPTLAGFRTRVSEIRLKYGIKLEAIEMKGKNKHGNTIVYHLHKLPETERKKAVSVYLKLVA